VLRTTVILCDMQLSHAMYSYLILCKHICYVQLLYVLYSTSTLSTTLTCDVQHKFVMYNIHVLRTTQICHVQHSHVTSNANMSCTTLICYVQPIVISI